MGKGQDGVLFCLPPERVELTVNRKKDKWQGQNGQRVKMGCRCLPYERVELTVNIKKETNGRVKLGLRSRCLPSERVELKLTVNSKKETNDRVKMDKESRWAAVVRPLKESN